MSIHQGDIGAVVVDCGPGVTVRILRLVAAGDISKTGVLADPALNQRFEPGFYDARFHVADYYRNAAGATAAVPFLDVVSYRFGIADPDAHYHLPMKCTPWGYSCFRGGA